MRLRLGSGSSVRLGSRTYDEELEYAALWGNADGRNRGGGNDGAKPTSIRRVMDLRALAGVKAYQMPAPSI